MHNILNPTKKKKKKEKKLQKREGKPIKVIRPLSIQHCHKNGKLSSRTQDIQQESFGMIHENKAIKNQKGQVKRILKNKPV